MRGLYILSKESCNWIKRYIYLNLFLCVIAYWISNQPLTDLIWDILQCQVISLSRTISWSLWIKVKLFNAHHKVCGTHMSLSLTQKQRLFSIVSKKGIFEDCQTYNFSQFARFSVWYLGYSSFVFNVKLENVTIAISFNSAYCSKSSTTDRIYRLRRVIDTFMKHFDCLRGRYLKLKLVKWYAFWYRHSFSFITCFTPVYGLIISPSQASW